MKKIIVANWKMNPSSLVGANKIFNEIKKKIFEIKKNRSDRLSAIYLFDKIKYKK